MSIKLHLQILLSVLGAPERGNRNYEFLIALRAPGDGRGGTEPLDDFEISLMHSQSVLHLLSR